MKNLIDHSDRIFVAGHNGMVGSAIVRHLKRCGYGVKGKGSILTADRSELDLEDSSKVQEWISFNKPHIVILAAAKVGGIYANASLPTEFLLSNLKIQMNVIESSWRNNVKRFCFLGSSCIYPKFAKQPIQEECLLNGQLESTNEAYAIAKISGIKLLEALNKQYGFDSFSLMPTNLYGPGDNYHLEHSHVMAAFIRRFCNAADDSLPSVTCWGSGSPFREFLHVDDLASAVLFCLESWKPDIYNPSFLNVGTGSDLSILDLAHKVAFAAGFKGKVLWDNSKPDGTPRKLLDISKLAALGWQAQVSLDKGIQSAIDDWRTISDKVHESCI